jgi:tetratricopeptide (TPR) repeat protein
VQLQAAVALDPSFAAAQHNLGSALASTGRFVEAHAALSRALDLYPSADPRRSVGAQKLQDCERFIELERRLPAVLRGDDRVAESADLLLFAELCHWKKRFATAVRFYENAFGALPAVVDDPRQSVRYNAACAAALAGTGAAQEPEQVGESEQARYREAALRWLRAELAAVERRIAGGTPQERAARGRQLAGWSRDPDLSRVRDEAGLGQLPPADRRAWITFWADVETLARNDSPGR